MRARSNAEASWVTAHQVRTAIKAYYGNTKDDTTVNPVTGNTDLYTYARDGAYAQEARGLARSGKKILREEADAGVTVFVTMDGQPVAPNKTCAAATAGSRPRLATRVGAGRSSSGSTRRAASWSG